MDTDFVERDDREIFGTLWDVIVFGAGYAGYAAAFSVNVETKIDSGAMPRLPIRFTTRSTIAIVLPAPGPAMTKSGTVNVVDDIQFLRIYM